MAELVQADSRRIPSMLKGKLLIDSEGWADDKFGAGCKEKDDIEHPREGKSCIGEECELVGGGISIRAAESEPLRYGIG